MSRRAAIGGAFGVVVGVVGGAAMVATVLVALGLPAESRADEPPPIPIPRPIELVVALTLTNPSLQAGAVRDNDVILARGLEVEIAREIGRRIGIPRVRFVYVRPASRLLAGVSRPWHIVIASVSKTPATAAQADLSEPYLVADQAVVLRRGLPAAKGIDDLRSKIVCAVRGSAGASVIASRLAPTQRPILAPSSGRLLQLVQTGVCDAALVDAGTVGQFVAGRGGLLGPISARVVAADGYVVAVTRGGPIAVAEVNRALRRMRADGTLHRLTVYSLGIDPWRLRPLGAS